MDLDCATLKLLSENSLRTLLKNVLRKDKTACCMK